MRSRYTSLVDPIIEQVQKDPDRLAVIHLSDDESEEMITAGRLHADACAFSQALKGINIEPEDIVIIALNHSRSLISAFWGIIYLGAVPSIFTYPVPGIDPKIYLKQLHEMVISSGARSVVTSPEFETGLSEALNDVDCRVLNIGKIRTGEDNYDISLPGSHTSKEQIAYLQYSSGTTGLQKGVLLSHRAILNFISHFTKDCAIRSGDVIVNWMPLYHDFGLFSGLIHPMALGVPTVLISPFKWIRNPKILLWAIHKHKGTISRMPNFGFVHLARSVRDSDIEGMDFGHLRIMATGGEPIIHNHMQTFLKRFKPYGIREKIIVTGYGMAENTLNATSSLLEDFAPVDWISVKRLQEDKYASPTRPNELGSMPAVSCGVPVRGSEIKIVDDNGQPLEERAVGEIVIRTKTLFSGYNRRSDLYAKVMRDGWFHTGDRGYMAGGHLYVCGRKKDLIIVGGQNIHPEDLEAVANKVPGIAPGRAVAFGVMDENFGSERIVLVCDLKGSFSADAKQQIERNLRRRIFKELNVSLTDVHLVEKGWVVKTSSGKISRSANRKKYQKLLDNKGTSGNGR